MPNVNRRGTRGWTRGDDEVAIVDILKSAPYSDAQKLIRQFSWKELNNNIGEEFANAFPKDKYK